MYAFYSLVNCHYHELFSDNCLSKSSNNDLFAVMDISHKLDCHVQFLQDELEISPNLLEQCRKKGVLDTSEISAIEVKACDYVFIDQAHVVKTFEWI